MAEWLKATDCKSVDKSLHRFESYFSHRKVPIYGSYLPSPPLPRKGHKTNAVPIKLLETELHCINFLLKNVI